MSKKGKAAVDHDEEFETVESGASKTYPKQCSALRKNEFVMIKGHPCKIVEMSTSKTGKHGHAKVHLVGIDIFENKKYEDICPSTHNMDVPIVNRKEYQCMSMDGEGYLTLLDDGGETFEHLKVTDDQEVKKELAAVIDGDKEVLVSVVSACGQEKVMSCKTGTSKD